MAVSENLLAEFRTWQVQEVEGPLYHGCKSDDLGINLRQSNISGIKWFSSNSGTAGDYAWFHTRSNSKGTNHLATVQIRTKLRAIVKPTDFSTTRWLNFLSEAFPDTNAGFGLSRRFQDALIEHLSHLYGNEVQAFAWKNQEEVLIPTCEKWISTISYSSLPPDQKTYHTQIGRN